MVETIRNPLVWGSDAVSGAWRRAEASGAALGGREREGPLPEVRRLEMADLREALRRGIEDAAACRSDAVMAILLYPVIGALIAWFVFEQDLVRMLFPAAAGFALLGPVAAVGLYEMSRRREMGQAVRWADGLGVLGSPSIGAILTLGLALAAAFALWLLAAWGIHDATLGAEAPRAPAAFAQAALGTPEGWTMILVGCAVGFAFAAVVLAMSVVSFPLLLDRDVGLPRAVATSFAVTRRSPGVVAAWGLIVAGALALGSAPLFVGLVLVMPALGHATWHLYRRAVPRPGEA